MSRHAERLRSVRAYDQPTGVAAIACWADAATEGSCNGCRWPGRVAVIHAGSFALRLCARCLNNINANLGGLRK